MEKTGPILFYVYNPLKMKKFLVVVFLFLGAIVVALSFSEFGTIMSALQKAHLTFFLLAILLQVVWFIALGRMYNSVFYLLGIEESTLTLSKVAAAANFVNVVAPSAGMGGVALFAAEARRRGHPSGKVTMAAALTLMLDQASFLVILSLGLIVLVRRNDLDVSTISASFLLFCFAISYVIILYLGYRSEEKLGNLLAKAVQIINGIVRFFRVKKDVLSEDRAHEFAHEVAEGFAGLTERTTSLVRPVLWGILCKVLLMGVLMFSFLSFEVPFSAGTIIAGFSLTYLFLIVSPTPSGIGVVEGMMPIILTSLNVEWGHAVLITLTYRTVTFWVPFGVGALAFRTLHARGEQPASA
jgi:glycosyltransferase 2 family protein